MSRQDPQGLIISGASAIAARTYQQALHQFQCYQLDPVATVEQAIANSPGFVMAHCLHAYLHLLGTEPAGFAVAGADWEVAQGLPATSRERAHLAAISHLLDNEWHRASRVLEDLSIEHPTDVLALQTGHLVDFYTGQSRLLRDRIARARPAWSADLPGYHAVLGMHAFGLEETGEYRGAESLGREAVELEPRDTWAWHAVAHVFEMQGREREGIAWLERDTPAWSENSFFSVHLWWHLALYHLALGDVERVLALFDGPIAGPRSPVVLDLIDASAMLWRLHLQGIEVGGRWQAVAEGWAPFADAGNYAFNDAHAVMAFVGAGRFEAITTVRATQQRVAEGFVADAGDNRFFVREVGAPVTAAIAAFGAGDFGEAVRLLRPVRDRANRFGGSHAQRDLLDLTLIEAALRDGQVALARALIHERLDRKPASPANRALLARVQPASARPVQAQALAQAA